MTDVAPWVIPDTLNDMAETILTTVGKALDDNAVRGYENRLIAPGADFALDTPGTVAIIMSMLHEGKIGVQQFSGMEPGEAAWAQTVGVFKLELWNKTPVPEPSTSAVAGFRGPTATQLTAAAKSLLQAGFIAFAALQTAQYTNVLFPFKPALIGPLEPIGPRGGYAGMGLTVQIQMP